MLMVPADSLGRSAPGELQIWVGISWNRVRVDILLVTSYLKSLEKPDKNFHTCDLNLSNTFISRYCDLAL